MRVHTRANSLLRALTLAMLLAVFPLATPVLAGGGEKFD
jgi:hypothetical protein